MTANPAAALKDACAAAFVALILALPLAGFATIDLGNGTMGVVPRPAWVGWGVLGVFVGRLALSLAGRLAPAMAQVGRSNNPERLARGQPHGARAAGLALALFAALLPVMPFASRYIVDLGTSVLIYVMLGWGLNIVVGLAGLLDLGYVAFYAVGAYSFALAARWFGLTFWEALPISGALAASFGILLGFPVLRLRGDYLAIVTLGFGEMIRIVLLNWTNVTGGPNGLLGIPHPSFLGKPLTPGAPTPFDAFFHAPFNMVYLYYVILVLALLTNLFALRLRRLPIGRAWEALREDEIAARALGINPTTAKLSAFAIGAMLGGFAGAFFATRLGFISPESFTFEESAIIVAIVVLGGMGSQMGVVLAATVLVTLPEFGRAFAEFRMLIFGAAMVAIMIWRPQGLIAQRTPSIRLVASAPR